MNIKRGLLRCWIIFCVAWCSVSLYSAPSIVTATELTLTIPIFNTANNLTIPFEFNKKDTSVALGKIWDDHWNKQQTVFQKSTAQKQLESDVETLLQANISEEIIGRYIKNSRTKSHLWDTVGIPKEWQFVDTKEKFISTMMNKANKQLAIRTNEQLKTLKKLVLPPVLLFLSAYSMLWAFAGFKRTK